MGSNKLETSVSTSLTRIKNVVIRNKFTFSFYFLFSVIYVLPLLLANVYYMDDFGRAIYGSGWSHDGRGLSTFIMTKITGGGGFITDYFPYSTIFAASIVVVSGYIAISTMGLEKGSRIKLSALLFLINPFFLENLSFRWDAIPMAVSMLCVIIPFLFVSSNWLFILLSVLGILGTMFTYQASLPIFVLMALMVLITKCMKGDKDLLRSIFLFGGSFILGMVVHKLLTWNVSLGERASIIPLDDTFFDVLTHNIVVATSLIKSAFSSYFMALVGLSVLLALVGFVKFLRSDKPLLNKVLVPLFSLFVIVLVPTTILILEVIYLGGRVMVTFPFLILLIFVFVNYLSKKIVPYLCLLFIVLSFALMSSYANSLKSQVALASHVSQNIAQTVAMNNKKVVFIGELQYAPEVYGATHKNPLFNYIVPHYLGDVWSSIVFAKMNGYLSYPNFSVIYGPDQGEIIKNKEQLPIVDETFYYVLRADSTTLVIDFDASTSKEQKINIPQDIDLW